MNIYQAMYRQMAADPIGWNYCADGTISKSTESVLLHDVALLLQWEFDRLLQLLPVLGTEELARAVLYAEDCGWHFEWDPNAEDPGMWNCSLVGCEGEVIDAEGPIDVDPLSDEAQRVQARLALNLD